jgi:hypothetical protein
MGDQTQGLDARSFAGDQSLFDGINFTKNEFL